jgi:hypothetical protein
VDCNVHLATQQSIVNLLGEQALATDISQGNVQDLIACGLDNDNLHCSLFTQLREVGL